MTESRLKTKFAAYQARRWKEDKNGEWICVPFMCPDNNPSCPINFAGEADLDDDEAYQIIGGLIELDHSDGSRFSKTGTTYPEQVIPRCRECHTRRHANDPSASRLPRKK